MSFRVLMFKRRRIVITITAFVLGLVVSTQVYAQSTQESAASYSHVSNNTFAYEKSTSGVKTGETVYKDAVSNATTRIETPTTSILKQSQYENLAGLWGG
ncbi:MAG: hypothetical protein HC862_21630 [Scytonema sp. RU_4_4]|nr:hypothetical protein [Scytonema sp. RU_4_4]